MIAVTADFETTTQKDDCRVWAWAICDIISKQVEIGNSMDSFIEFIRYRNLKIYFHNVKFDGEFILYYLFTHGFIWVDKKVPDNNEFTTTIDGMGRWYIIKINFDGNIISIYDSLKIIPLPVEAIPKAFGLPINKLNISYTKYRPKNHILTEQEKAYISNDVVIVAHALEYMFKQGLNKITQGANALMDFKNKFGNKSFDKAFPILPYDAEIRQAYRGGFTYANPIFTNKVRGKGIVLDVNSLYPYVMYDKLLPYGEGTYFEGKYQNDKNKPLYIQMIRCNFEIKPKHIPTIQIKNSLSFIPNAYLESSMVNGKQDEVTLCLTNVDLDLFLEHYNVYNIEYLGGYKFRGKKGLFKEYIDYWIDVKINADKDGNPGMRQIAKLMLNSLYGKFGTSPKLTGKEPWLNEDGIIKFKRAEEKTRKPIYIPMAVFITAYSRDITIRAAQQNYDRFLYADTDSLHLLDTEIPDNIRVDDYELGAWKHESTFDKCKYLRQKCYLERIVWHKGKKCEKFNNVVVAGLPSSCHDLVTFDNFNLGTTLTLDKKLKPSHVKGGIILEGTSFTIHP